MTTSAEDSVSIPVLTSDKESQPSAEAELYQAIRLGLCRWSMEQPRGRHQIKNSVKEHKRRGEFLSGLDAQQLAELRTRIVSHWPGMRKSID